MHIRQAVVAAAVTEGEPFVIHAGQMKNRRVEIVSVNFVFHHCRADVIGAAVHQLDEAHTAFGEPPRLMPQSAWVSSDSLLSSKMSRVPGPSPT